MLTQCLLERRRDEIIYQQTLWIDSSKAAVGRKVRLKDVPGEWTVKAVWQSKDDKDVAKMGGRI